MSYISSNKFSYPINYLSSTCFTKKKGTRQGRSREKNLERIKQLKSVVVGSGPLPGQGVMGYGVGGRPRDAKEGTGRGLSVALVKPTIHSLIGIVFLNS